MLVELGFPILGRTLPKDNGYLLYAALSRHLSGHSPADVGIASVGGARLSEGSVALGPRAALRIRTASERIPELLGLAGSELDVGGHRVSLAYLQYGAWRPHRIYSRTWSALRATSHMTHLSKRFAASLI